MYKCKSECMRACSNVGRKSTQFSIQSVFVIDDEKENVDCDHYKVHQEPITCFYNQKKNY